MAVPDLNFIPLDREVQINPDKVMICKFTPEGIIEYVNDYFIEVSGYEVHEIVGGGIDIFRHNDLPSTIFNYIMEHLMERKNIRVLLKDQIKDGRHYWYLTNFEFKDVENSDKVAFISYRHAVPRHAVDVMEDLYARLLKIEKYSGLNIAKNYFEGFNEENGLTFEEYTKQLVLSGLKNVNSNNLHKIQVKPDVNNSKNKSLFSKLFKK